MVDMSQTQRTEVATGEHHDVDVLVTTGTDYHQFDRLIEAVEGWAARRAADGRPVRCCVQAGASRPPTSLPWARMFEYHDHVARIGEATVVVSHGGPATIMEIRAAGHRPIVLPRDPALGEHVDDHQQRFTARLAQLGQIRLATDADALGLLLDDALDAVAVEPLTPDAGPDIAATYIGDLVDRLTTVASDGPNDGSILFACSNGGHLAQLLRLKPWWSDRSRTWVTFDTIDARSLLGDERVYWAHWPTTRNIPNLLRNTRLAWRLLRRVRPAVVVSNGAGVAVPFFWLARALGIATVYVEVYDRIDVPTLTARLCRPVTDLMLLQWPEQRQFYRRGILVGRLL